MTTTTITVAAVALLITVAALLALVILRQRRAAAAVEVPVAHENDEEDLRVVLSKMARVRTMSGRRDTDKVIDALQTSVDTIVSSGGFDPDMEEDLEEALFTDLDNRLDEYLGSSGHSDDGNSESRLKTGLLHLTVRLDAVMSKQTARDAVAGSR